MYIFHFFFELTDIYKCVCIYIYIYIYIYVYIYNDSIFLS